MSKKEESEYSRNYTDVLKEKFVLCRMDDLSLYVCGLRESPFEKEYFLDYTKKNYQAIKFNSKDEALNFIAPYVVEGIFELKTIYVYESK